MQKPTADLLTPGLIAMIDKGVSVIVSSCSPALKPSIMRAVASAISPGGGTVTVYLARSQSRQLLQDIATTGRIAAVFSEPSTHRTVQLKARSARVRPASEPEDEAALQAYGASMEHEIACVGYAASFTRAMLACQPGDVVAVSFEPEEAFDQTPGPKAGAAITAQRSTS
ncbi:MAG: hypothetical protein V4731_02275 [Pseudomonadota bacterium]